jgi:hypothetical protein
VGGLELSEGHLDPGSACKQVCDTTPKRPTSDGRIFRTMTIEASIVDLRPLVMCTSDGRSCIALGGDARIKFVLSAVLLDLTSNGWHVSHGADLTRRKLSLLSYVMHR